MFNRIIGSLFLVYMAITSLLFYGIALSIWCITIPFDKNLKLLHLFTCFWASLYLWSMPAWVLSTSGRENFKKGEVYVIVSNHQSQLDILLGFLLFRHFKWVSKASMFKMPFVGWNMSLNQYVKLERGTTSGIKKMMKSCKKCLQRGNSIWLFPEGTRSKDGAVHRFRGGAFALAQKMELPILPVVINGTGMALPKNSVNFHGKNNISLEVLPAIYPESYADKSSEELASMVREVIAEHVIPVG